MSPLTAGRPWLHLGRAGAPGRPAGAPSAATLAVMREADATMTPAEQPAYVGPVPGAPYHPRLLPKPGPPRAPTT